MTDDALTTIVQQALRDADLYGDGSFYERSPGQLPDHVHHRVARFVAAAVEASGWILPAALDCIERTRDGWEAAAFGQAWVMWTEPPVEEDMSDAQAAVMAELSRQCRSANGF